MHAGLNPTARRRAAAVLSQQLTRARAARAAGGTRTTTAACGAGGQGALLDRAGGHAHDRLRILLSRQLLAVLVRLAHGVGQLRKAKGVQEGRGRRGCDGQEGGKSSRHTPCASAAPTVPCGGLRRRNAKRVSNQRKAPLPSSQRSQFPWWRWPPAPRPTW